ncbi:MAG: heavy metal translocating P-type ATPase [Planctomycetota bacterium]|jgi:Cd2+/Zn2+-exporting ATPase
MPRLSEVDIPAGAVATDDGPACSHLMEEALESEPGVRSVVLDWKVGVLRLRYDPAVVSLNRVQYLARQLGVKLDGKYERCSLRVQGIRCTDCASGVGRALERLPGVANVVVNPAAEVVAVEYDGLSADLETIQERLGRTGYLAGPPPGTRAAFRASEARHKVMLRRMTFLTVACLAGLLLGWLGQRASLLSERAVLASYVVAYLAGGFYSTKRVIQELRTGSITVDLLMIAAALGAAVINAWAEGAILLFLFSTSNTLEAYVLGRTRRAIEALMDLTPEEAVVRRNGQEQRVPVEALRPGDTVIVRPAERIAADGVVRLGSTSVDQSPMTGESIPVDKRVGDAVFAGTLNQQGVIELEVTKLAGDTTLARLVRLVAEAQTAKAGSQRFSDWFGQRYTIGVLAAAAVTLLVPFLFLAEPFGPAFYRAMTVLVVASPCAVVISIPATILVAITSAARGGVLLKGGAHLERLATIRAVAFDKTGTLTFGRPQVVDVQAADGSAPDEVLRLAASVERLSEHPLARAVVEAAEAQGLQLEPASEAEALVGHGMRARLGERVIRVGKEELFRDGRSGIPAPLLDSAWQHRAIGSTVILVGDDGHVLGQIAIADTVRPGAEDAIRRLGELGVEHLVMLTGDSRAVAESIAGPLGLDFEAELLPEDKLRVIQRLRKTHGAMAMVGDGINDAPSLAVADLGISLGGAGTDVALETADVILMADDLRHLPYGIALARQAGRIIRQNLVFAFGVMALLLGVTYFGSLRLPLAVAGHEGSTVLVILNGLRLLAFPRPTRKPARAATGSTGVRE